jgi:diguanylate cyclase (GGDEF)-like protein
VARQVDTFAHCASLLGRLDASVDELRYLATHDALTGLANRAVFDQRLQAETQRPGTVSILLIDLDDLKAVNDALGHLAGDAVLVGVADRLRRCVRADDLAARIGGDEFVIMLRESSAADARRVAQRIQASLDVPLMIEGDPIVVSASVGVAIGELDDAQRLVRRADEAMYDAKVKGKHTFVMAAADWTTV